MNTNTELLKKLNKALLIELLDKYIKQGDFNYLCNFVYHRCDDDEEYRELIQDMRNYNQLFLDDNKSIFINTEIEVSDKPYGSFFEYDKDPKQTYSFHGVSYC